LEQTDAQEAAEFAHTRITKAFASCRTDCKPHLITGSRAIHGLQHEVQTEGKLKLADNDYRRLLSPYCHQIAATDFTLDRVA
jgi:hypothetical protein